jgi:photosystem II stability/assembly factor-like uncharacterized protein
MRVVLKALVLSPILTFFLCSVSIAQQAARIESMKLLTPDVVWALKALHLFWTSDSGRSWRDITPPLKPHTEIASVFFVDTSIGWALLVHRSEAINDVAGFELASTGNAGGAWRISPVKIPDLDPQLLLPGDARLFFFDDLHGWINVGSGGSAFDAGFLIATTDGGKTWAHTGDGSFEAGGRGSVLFTSPKDGWFTNRMELFVTHDGASHWRKVSLTAPPQIKPAVDPAYDLPVLRAGRMFLSVTYSSPYFPEAQAQSARRRRPFGSAPFVFVGDGGVAEVLRRESLATRVTASSG